MRSLMSGNLTILTISRLSRAMMFRDVPAGTNTPIHASPLMSGKPASAKVGTSGSAGGSCPSAAHPAHTPRAPTARSRGSPARRARLPPSSFTSHHARASGYRRIELKRCQSHELGVLCDVLVMCFAIAGGRRQCGVGPAENACHVATIFPAPGADARDRKVRNRDISGLDVHEQGRRQHGLIQRAEQRGLADTAVPEYEDLPRRLL